ncbi:hypothetical protein Arub01_42240 [Actinomadura rubrobrunea]|uniref:Mce-associated membrane protein n=1 Tax=Actinomadura rubrobrunea TaxID=115335 RepID=A0A9W6PX12_9ACTN|nr:hypothetical protein [Actinomadura rubrobrunea]GLW65980.1 hypothetical protein Arub01_42240 [Actinomadura rubrobrunea]
MTTLGRRKRDAAAKKAEKARRRAEEAARKAREAAEAAERAAREAAEAEAERAAVEGEDEAAPASADDSTTESRSKSTAEAKDGAEAPAAEKPETADDDDGDGSQEAATDEKTEEPEPTLTKTEDDAADEDGEQRDQDEASDEDEHDEDEEDEPERAPGRLRRLAGAVASAGALGYTLIAVNVALVAGLVWLVVAVHRADGREAAADQVKFAASRAAEDLSSYDFRTIDADLKRAAGQTTGRFKSQFQQLTASVRTSATRQQAVVEGTAVKTAVESVDGDRAIALVYLNQQTAKGSSGQRTPSQFAMRLVMRKVGDRWLVSELHML